MKKQNRPPHQPYTHFLDETISLVHEMGTKGQDFADCIELEHIRLEKSSRKRLTHVDLTDKGSEFLGNEKLAFHGFLRKAETQRLFLLEGDRA